MPKLTHAFEQNIRRAIRDAYALDPLIDGKRVLEFCNKQFNHSFHWSYIGRLIKKVNAEATPNLDREKIEPRLRVLRERQRLGVENLLKIAHGQTSANKDKIAAWRAIAMLDKLLLDAELELGLYSRTPHEDLPDAFRYRAIPEEIRLTMVETAKVWQLPTALTRKIEPMQAEVVEIKETAGEGVKVAPSPRIEPIKQNGTESDPVLEFA